MINPFESGPVQNPRHFIGRREACESAKRILQDGKRSPHRMRNILISGQEGTGKSSLMRYITWLAEKEKYYVFSGIAREFKNAPSPIISYLHFFMHQLLKKAQLDNLFDKTPNFALYLAALQRLPLSGDQLLGLHLLDFPSWYYGYTQTPNAGSVPLPPWSHDLRIILETAEKKRGIPGCVFALDDVEALNDGDTRIFLDAVRSTFDALEECRVMFILTGDANLRRLVQQQRGMSANFLDAQTRPWSFEEVSAYVRRPELEAQKLRATDERIRELLDITEGSPTALAFLCYCIFEACLAHNQESFEPSEAVIEQVCDYIEGVSDLDVIERIKRLTRRDLIDLAQLAPFDKWTIEEIARFRDFNAHPSNDPSDLVAQEQHLQSIRDLYVQQGLFKNDIRVSVAGSSLERAYLRFRARGMDVNWAEQFRGRIPWYEEWAEQAVEAQIVKISGSLNFPLRKWIMWHIPAQEGPESLEQKIKDWLQGIKEGIAPSTTVDERLQFRLVEEAPGKFIYKLDRVESPLLELDSPQQQVAVDFIGLQFALDNGTETIIQLYQMPSNSPASITPILAALTPTTSLLGLRLLEHWSGHFELPHLEEVIELARSKANMPLISECIYTCVSLGRRYFERGEVDAARKWFSIAATTPEEHIRPNLVATARNGYGFVSIGFKQWDLARNELSEALKRYSHDNMIANRAMTTYDIAYIDVMQERSFDAERRCREALEDPNSDARCAFLWVKLCDIDNLPPMEYWDADLARRPVIAAATYCTLAAMYAHRKKWRDAEQALAKADELDGDHYMVLRAWGRYYLRRGRPTEALEMFERARVAYADFIEKLGLESLGEVPGGQPIPVSPAIYDELEFTRELEKQLRKNGGR